jgi:hypothetical protein
MQLSQQRPPLAVALEQSGSLLPASPAAPGGLDAGSCRHLAQPAWGAQETAPGLLDAPCSLPEEQVQALGQRASHPQQSSTASSSNCKQQHASTT